MPIPPSDPIVNIPIVTPFDELDRVDHNALARNIERWLATPAAGFLVGSQTGEEACLSEPEKLAIAKTVKENLDDRRFLIGGIDCPAVAETLRRAEAFAKVGAEVVRIRFPRHASQVEPYFEQVLPRCPVPVLLMHQCNPVRFGMAAEPAAAPEVLGCVADMENVFGYVTDHDVRFEAQVRRCITRDRRFWICNGSLILHGTLIGCNGTTTAFSNIWPAALDELLVKGMAGRYQEAEPLQELVQKIDAVMLPFLAAGVKAVLGLLGFEGMRPRSPTPAVSNSVVASLEQLMREAGLLNRSAEG
ncbi:MAG: dihydrodipicolinate synthase family protein [Planctomycetes bacterium]|nr:dihydrodipicolinate synthase family protein [Planctomycetota bacterium]